MSFTIDPRTCVECGQCRRFCPIQNAIYINADYQHTIAADLCSGCGLCEAFCPVPGAIGPAESRQVSRQRSKVLRRVVWRSQWYFHHHPVMGRITLDARLTLQVMNRSARRARELAFVG